MPAQGSVGPAQQSERVNNKTLRARPTMQDVAAVAGVSLKTVSRVVNNEPGVVVETRERVNNAISALGFRRNDIARSLRRGHSSATIGLVVEDLANPFYARIALGVEQVARRYEYMVILSNSEENVLRERELVNELFMRRVEGLLIVPTGRDHTYIVPELHLGTPVVFLDRPATQAGVDAVLLDNRGGARTGVEHLMAHGHRRIALLCGNPGVHTMAERIKGYREALEQHHIAFNEQLLSTNCDCWSGVQAALQRYMQMPEPPTAFFTTSNRVSVLLLRALQGIVKQPGFVGFDDFELAEMLPVPATVVAHDPLELGQQAAELLFTRLAGNTCPPQQIMLPTYLVERGSGELPPY